MTLESQEHEIAISIVEALVEYGLCEHLSEYGENNFHKWFKNKELGEMGFWATSGVSKVVFSHEDLEDWVFKVGFTEKVRYDYAQIEYDNYCAAINENLEYFFPETIFLGTFGGRKFFLQECAICDEESVNSEWYNIVSTQMEEDGEEFDDESIWDRVEDMDDAERAEAIFGNPELCDFLSEHRIGDLHSGNFGIVADHWVIIDFSGWFC